MAKRKQQQGVGGDAYGEMAGALGGLVISFGGLAALKERLGLSWLATVLLVTGVLVFLGYLAWRIRTVLAHAWSGGGGKPKTAKAQRPEAAEKVAAVRTGLGAEAPAQPPPAAAAAAGGTEEATGEVVEADPSHPELTAALRSAGAIGREEVILANEVTVEPVQTGKRWDFLMPPGRTYQDVEKNLGRLAGVWGVTRLHTKLERSRATERQVQMLVLDQPPFSEAFPAPTRKEIAEFDGVPFGHDVVGQLAGVPTFEKASLLVGGMTQTGKTTLINGLITCLLIAYGDDFDLYLLDGKFCGLTRFEKVAVRYEASDNPAVFEEMVDELNGRSDRRYEKIQEAIRNREPAPKFRPVFFVVDEAADFFAHDGTPTGRERAARIAEKTRGLVAKCLESGIASIMLTQRPSQNAIPVMVRDQFLYRMCLYVASEGTAKVALGDTYFDTVAPINPVLMDSQIRGQGVLFAHGVSTLLRGFWFSDEFMWGVVDEVYDRQQRALAKAPKSPLMQAIDLMQDQGQDFMATSDLAPAVGIAETDPTERGKQLNRLLGVPADKGPKGVRGYRLADLTAAAMSDS